MAAATTSTVDVMEDNRARFAAVLSALDGIRFTGLESREVAEVQELFRKVTGRVHVGEAALLRHAADLNAQGRGAHPLDVARDAGMVSDKDAYRKTRAAELLEQTPALADALAEGKLSMGHIETIAQHADRMHDSDRAHFLAQQDDLTRTASRLGVADFQREMRRRRELDLAKAGEAKAAREKRQDRTTIDWNPATGRFHMQVHAGAVMGQRITTIIDAEIARMIADADVGDAHPDLVTDRNHLRTYALMNVLSSGHQATNARCAPASSGVVSEVSVLIDWTTLIDGLREDSVLEISNGMPLDLASARRMACEATIIPIVLGATGQALDVGRDHRLATRAQRRALRAMYRTCMIDGCSVPFDRCEIHHLTPWEDGGSTDVDNLGPVCPFHHHQIHERGWRLHLDADRTLHVRQADGTWLTPSPFQPLTPPPDAAATSDDPPPPGAPPSPPGDGSTDGTPPDVMPSGDPGEPRGRS